MTVQKQIQVKQGMVLIPANTFLMGCDDKEVSKPHKPIHNVYVSAFWMDSQPVTNEQFTLFVKETGYLTTAEQLKQMNSIEVNKATTWKTFATQERQDHPVVNVSWYDAVAYCEWAGKRLPTEAEWEYAARGNLKQKQYPWGNGNPKDKAAWNRFNFENGTLPVKSFESNAFGLYDLSANVWEWCSDWYQENYYTICAEQETTHNPKGAKTGTYKVRRGAAWNISESFRMTCANRGTLLPAQFWSNQGFRCVQSIEE